MWSFNPVEGRDILPARSGQLEKVLQTNKPSGVYGFLPRTGVEQGRCGSKGVTIAAIHPRPRHPSCDKIAAWRTLMRRGNQVLYPRLTVSSLLIRRGVFFRNRLQPLFRPFAVNKQKRKLKSMWLGSKARIWRKILAGLK
jgi:hypothetical protein